MNRQLIEKTFSRSPRFKLILAAAVWTMLLALFSCDGISQNDEQTDDSSQSVTTQDEPELLDPWESIAQLRILPAWFTVSPVQNPIHSKSPGFRLDTLSGELIRLDNEAARQYATVELPPSLLEPSLPPTGEQMSSTWYPALIENYLLTPEQPGGITLYDVINRSSRTVYLPGGAINSVSYQPLIPGSLFLSSRFAAVSRISLDGSGRQWTTGYARPVRILGISGLNQDDSEDDGRDDGRDDGQDDAVEGAEGEGAEVEDEDSGRRDEDQQAGDTQDTGDSIQPVLILVSDSGWFAIVDPDSGELIDRSLDMPGFRAAALSGDGNLLRSGGGSAEMLRLTREGEILSLVKTSLPWRSPQSVALNGNLMLGLVPEDPSPETEEDASGTEPVNKASTLIFAVDLLSREVPWTFVLEGGYDRIIPVGGMGYLLESDEHFLFMRLNGSDARRDFPVFLHYPASTPGRSGLFEISRHIVPRLDAPGFEEIVGQTLRPELRLALPVNSVSESFALVLGPAQLEAIGRATGADGSDFIHKDRNYRYSVSSEVLPLEIAVNPQVRRRGRFSVESTRQILLRIFDDRGNELLSSLDKVSLEPELDYTLDPGQYVLRLEDAGGEVPEDSFVLLHRNF